MTEQEYIFISNKTKLEQAGNILSSVLVGHGITSDQLKEVTEPLCKLIDDSFDKIKIDEVINDKRS